MEPSEVEDLIRAGMPDCEVTVSGDGSHFEAVVVSPAFAGLSAVARQRLVYATVNAEIASGRLHALSFKTYTPEEQP
ncbi:MAG: BolA family transcriptional regulator [Chromatiales bacterium]|nr:BolA family transcriptional regulator [Chromatiales bacterium]